MQHISCESMSVGRSPILWQNEDQTVTLFDIPRSISAAQGTTENPCNATLLSSRALQSPFPTNEPRTSAAKSRLQGNAVNEQLNDEYHNLAQQALEAARANHNGSWCLERPFLADVEESRPSKKRRLDADGEIAPKNETCPTIPSKTVQPSPNIETGCPDCDILDSNFFSNCTESPISRGIPDPHNPSKQTGTPFRMPPNSSCYLGPCEDTRAFHTNIRNHAQAHDTPRHFDFILLDPPWPNRSVKRTHKTPGTSYSTPATLQALRRLILNTDLEMLMAENGLVGIWITNKPAIRDLVDEIFAAWLLELEEEWIWLKTTEKGEPVMPLDSLWRKPYEVLLLARRRRTSFAAEPKSTRRRVVVGVPDLHSRKPCLKELLEPLLPGEYRALEVFARYLVSGWCSWGNECVKFNGVDNWRQ